MAWQWAPDGMPGPTWQQPQTAPYTVQVPVSNANDFERAMKLINKMQRKQELKNKKPEEAKKDEKKPSLTYLQLVAITLASTPFVMLANGLVILQMIKMFKGL